ncbi:hypothetical protein BDF14DRAFT_1862024 [Spinellus fusiger]|nr:hypothetical protein BDF14DRAFT_1862024 [Spinellus fusiger]
MKPIFCVYVCAYMYIFCVHACLCVGYSNYMSQKWRMSIHQYHKDYDAFTEHFFEINPVNE